MFFSTHSGNAGYANEQGQEEGRGGGGALSYFGCLSLCFHFSIEQISLSNQMIDFMGFSSGLRDFEDLSGFRSLAISGTTGLDGVSDLEN